MAGEVGVENLSVDTKLWDIDPLRCAAAAGQSYEDCSVRGRGRAGGRPNTRTARAIRSMQPEPLQRQEESRAAREFPSRLQDLSHLLHSIR